MTRLNLDWYTQPQDAGQIVVCEYAVDYDGTYLYRRITDRSDNSVVIQQAEITADATTEFEPENGYLPEHGAWEGCPVTVRAWDDGSDESIEVEYGDDDDYAAAAEDLWDGADYGDGDYRVSVSWEATDIEGTELASGSFDVEGQTAEPECPGDDGHDWTADGEGGLDENPGVWSVGGTAMVCHTHCRKCGLHRTERTTGSQHNPGECDTTEYRQLDDDEIAAHIANGDMDDIEAAQ